MSESDQAPAFDSPRLVVKKVQAKLQQEGDGAVVRRGIGRSELKSLDPFLMLDNFSVTHPAGFPDHPHRGFETVTYMLQGGITHQDFAGHKGTIGVGDVQWMTAGRGIIHSEMPVGEGTSNGLQLWINLSSKDKMVEPRYQELLCKDIERAEKEGVEVRIIAGESMGVRSPAKGCLASQNSSPVAAHNVLVLGPGDGLSVWNRSSKPLRYVLLAGQPLNEPVVQYGPFVMNTQAEIDRTIEDYHYSKNGFEMAKYWRSQ
uniref:Pirin-like protein n=1 Tax=Fagus sylvatica TaxID=28930 RepID=A0A2N9HWX2_FAGSY